MNIFTYTEAFHMFLFRDMSLKEYDNDVVEDNILDPRCVTPLERSRTKKKLRESKEEEPFKSQVIT